MQSCRHDKNRALKRRGEHSHVRGVPYIIQHAEHMQTIHCRNHFLLQRDQIAKLLIVADGAALSPCELIQQQGEQTSQIGYLTDW